MIFRNHSTTPLLERSQHLHDRAFPLEAGLEVASNAAAQLRQSNYTNLQIVQRRDCQPASGEHLVSDIDFNNSLMANRIVAAAGKKVSCNKLVYSLLVALQVRCLFGGVDRRVSLVISVSLPRHSKFSSLYATVRSFVRSCE